MFIEFVQKRIITRIKEMALPVTEIRKNYLKLVDKRTGEINQDVDVLASLKECSTINQLIEQGYCISLLLDIERARISVYLINRDNPSTFKGFSFSTDYFADKEQFLNKYKEYCISQSKESEKERNEYLKEQEDYKKQLYKKYLKLKKEFENE